VEKKVSMKQIAEKLNISSGAVSLTLNGRGDEMRISAETQRLIMDTAKEMGYPLEKVRKKRQTVGVNDLPVIVVFLPVLTEDVISPYDRVMNGLNQCMREKNINVEILVCPFEYGGLFKKYRYISSAFCTGAIVFSLSETDMDDLKSQEFDVPLVVFNRMNEKYSTVYVDDYNVGYKVAKLLKEKNCKEAALFSPNYYNKPILLRKMGFEDGCRDLGVELAPENNITCGTNHEEVEHNVINMCEKNSLPDMIFSNMDDIGLGIIKALKKRNILIPEETEVISYGDNIWTKTVSPAMSSIRLDIESMSGECMSLLWSEIQSGDWTPVAKIFESQFVYRETFLEKGADLP